MWSILFKFKNRNSLCTVEPRAAMEDILEIHIRNVLSYIIIIETVDIYYYVIVGILIIILKLLMLVPIFQPVTGQKFSNGQHVYPWWSGLQNVWYNFAHNPQIKVTTVSPVAPIDGGLAPREERPGPLGGEAPWEEVPVVRLMSVMSTAGLRTMGKVELPSRVRNSSRVSRSVMLSSTTTSTSTTACSAAHNTQFEHVHLQLHMTRKGELRDAHIPQPPNAST